MRGGSRIGVEGSGGEVVRGWEAYLRWDLPSPFLLAVNPVDAMTVVMDSGSPLPKGKL